MARVLVVDDKQAMRVMLEARLAAPGHTVETAESVAAANTALQGTQFDVVITDLRMGRGGDGLDVVRAVKARQPAAEVILMTAFGSDDVREKALLLGAYGYVEKSPNLAAEMIALVQAALGKRKLAQDNELLRKQLEARTRFEGMVGRSPALQSVV